VVEACAKCGSKEITWLETSPFVPHRSGRTSVEQKWPLNLFMCESCGYSEFYVRFEDIGKVKDLALTQKRLSDAVSRGLGVIE
jgi:predicted nucleic-acid-binding Zn-ribbon protein